MDTLKFGTDGWRDIIADKFTLRNISRAAQAYADYLIEQGQDSVVIGHDTRFNGTIFAQRVAEVMAANGLRTLLSTSYLPTPALSFATKHYQAGGGVMLTASHNPPEYHGFKLKGPYGGTATQSIYQQVSERVNQLSFQDVKAFKPHKHSYELFCIREAYYKALTELVDIQALRDFKGSIVHDPMGGAGAGWLKGFAEYADLSLKIEELNAKPNPLFYGVNPEPIPQNLQRVSKHMQHNKALFATATDGDGDRLGLVLPGGQFFNSHQIFAVILDWMSQKGVRGQVVKTFTVSRIIERLANLRNLDWIETPVGFKHIVNAMLSKDVLVGGEESGGIGINGHIPERDGLANSLILLEATIKTGLSIADMFKKLETETGWKHAYDRLDIKLSDNSLKESVFQALHSAPPTIDGRHIESVEARDGIKLNLSGQAWLLFRASGTEPLLRVYCEAQNSREVNNILGSANTFVQRFA